MVALSAADTSPPMLVYVPSRVASQYSLHDIGVTRDQASHIRSKATLEVARASPTVYAPGPLL